MKTRKARIDSASEAVRVMSAAAKTIAPPSNVPLDESDLPFFASVIAEFARSEWTAHQLELAAMLARTMSDLNREQRTLREEGSVCMSEKGNSGSQSEEVGSSDARRFLALHARAHTRDLADIAKRQGKAIAIAADNPLDDGLIARPN